VKAIIYQCLPCYRFKAQFVCFVTKAIHLEVLISLPQRHFLLPCAASLLVEDDPESSIPTKETTSEEHQINAAYLHYAAVIVPDGNDPGLPVQRRM
jgi:hypothetical protein